MVLSELTNKELKGILRENDVRNYSKMNKKGLLKKVNQLIKEQNGGNSGKGKNGKKKKYTLKDFIGGSVTPAAPAAPPGETDVTSAPPAAPAAAPAKPVPSALPAAPGSPGAQVTATPGATDSGANPTGATDPGATTKNNAKKGNNALYVYSAKSNGRKNSNGARGLPYFTEKTASENEESSSENNSGKNECGSCSMQ